MDTNSSIKSPAWIRPEDVMRVRKIKAKSKALQARMISSTNSLQILAPVRTQVTTSLSQGVKRRNPFRCSPNKTSKHDEDSNIDAASDASLFRLLNPANGKDLSTQNAQQSFDFTSFFQKELGSSSTPDGESSQHIWAHKLPVDWSLKTRLRFKSQKPLPWKHNFKTSEEASGTTGFVRCLTNSSSDDSDDRTLDTSANAKFYQCCLVWQHPNLPWLQLFPRDNVKISAQTGLFGTDQKLGDSLHAEWSESVRSLHQLLRVRQCPYFYMCGPTFTCLFRAAGVAGISQTHALITPTTRGFREAMKNEDIEFEMPFHNSKSETEGRSDLSEADVEENLSAVNDEEEGDEAKSWLEDLGVETSQFPNLNPNRVKLDREKFKNVDRTPTSLVYVEGMEIQGLVNFLLNSRSCIATTGPLAGVPPTLLAPVAFQGGTLQVLKAKGNLLHQDGKPQHSMEVLGPIMPHTVHQLTSLLCPAADSFSISLQPVISTLPFSQFTHQESSFAPQAFAQENLVDCGLDFNVRTLICAPHKLDDSELPNSYREVTYENSKFTWTDRLL